MKTHTIQETYKDPRWQRRRLEIMQRDGFACNDCGEEKKTLNVHHRYYVKGRKLWEYPDFSLVTLCRECHQFQHSEERFSEEDPENAAVLEEWEQMTDFVFGGDLKALRRAWDFSVSIASLCSGGADRNAVLSSIRSFLDSQRPEDFKSPNSV
ncbi:MAG TPA: hypothetical protein VIU12_02945 [Chryseolinea sp.]